MVSARSAPACHLLARRAEPCRWERKTAAVFGAERRAAARWARGRLTGADVGGAAGADDMLGGVVDAVHRGGREGSAVAPAFSDKTYQFHLFLRN